MTKKIDIAVIIEGITHEVNVLAETVRDYESDTFSSSAAKLSESELNEIVIELVNYALKELSELDRLDGVRLTEELDNIR